MSTISSPDLCTLVTQELAPRTGYWFMVYITPSRAAPQPPSVPARAVHELSAGQFTVLSSQLLFW